MPRRSGHSRREQQRTLNENRCPLCDQQLSSHSPVKCLASRAKKEPAGG